MQRVFGGKRRDVRIKNIGGLSHIEITHVMAARDKARCQKLVVGKKTHEVTIRCGQKQCFWRRWHGNPVL
ncbi:hypothetical protein SUGI_0101990 [Cryptomeria japonica]|nr:hypothetical protein SUGI_0101990 [Cryptomeria japonica]